MFGYASDVYEIGLFPLGLVLLPAERIPLHVFEARYKQLIGRCLEDGSLFGIVLAVESGPVAVGTKAKVVEVPGRWPDGRMNVIVEGRARFHLLQLTEGRTYVVGEAEDVVDEPGSSLEQEVLERCLEAHRRLAAVAGMDPPEIDLDPGDTAFRIAAQVDFGTSFKQELLEMRSEEARLSRLTDLLVGAAETLELQKLARKRARGNGQAELG